MVAKVQPKERGTQIEERVDDSGNYNWIVMSAENSGIG
jgi:hypothetical protein